MPRRSTCHRSFRCNKASSILLLVCRWATGDGRGGGAVGTKGAQQAHTRQQQTTNDPLTHLPRAVLQASCHRYCLPTERLAGRRILRAHSGQYWLRQFVYRTVTSAEQAESELRQGQREIMLQREPQFPGIADPHHSQRVQTLELASLGARQKAKHPGARQKATHPRQARSDLIRQ